MNEREYERMFAVEDHHWWYAGLHELILETISANKAEEPLRIFDAGCGTGRLAELMLQFGAVDGCDASAHAIEFSRSRGLSGMVQADLNIADLGESRYDVITSVDVLYHRAIYDEAAVLGKLYRALKPGGILILNLVAFEMLRSTHDLAVHTRKRYTRKDLYPLLRRQGFVIGKMTYRLAFLFIPIAIYRWTRRCLPHSAEAEQIDSDLQLPCAVVNRFLLHAIRLENTLLRYWNLPIGTSLFVTARRPR